MSMKIALVGPELEENLALRYIHASLVQAGHDCRIYDFHDPRQVEPVADGLAQWRPDIVGMSMVFTARSGEYVRLAQALRERGYDGHVTAGGHFASFHARELLRDVPAFSSILRGEGERAMVELAARLHEPAGVCGIVLPGADGEIVETPPGPPLTDLDVLPWPTRQDRFDSYLGLPIANILSSRGCYGACSFCSIRAWHRHIGGPRLRQRGVADLAAEMAELYHDSGVRIYNFHDDNFFLPDRQANLDRFAEIRRRLDERGVGRIAIQIKARPDSIDADALALLKELGLFRVFLGVESNAVAGLEALGRGIKRQQNHEALRLIRQAGLHVTFNLLMFEPDCTLADLRDNIDFIEAQSDVPLNFCRVEVYSGTPIQRRLAEQGRLVGDYWGYSYAIADRDAQRSYEVFREVFTPRNFFFGGANLQAMTVDYNLHLLRHFFPRRWSAALADDCRRAIGRLNRNNVELLREICRPGLEGRADRLVAALSRRREAFDKRITREFSRLLALMEPKRQPVFQRRLAKAGSLAAATILVTAMGCRRTHVYEMVPRSQPTASAPARPPVVPAAPAPYAANEAARLQSRLMTQYGQEIRNWMADTSIRETVVLDLEVTAAGEVAVAGATVEDGALPVRALEKLKEKSWAWRLPRPSRAGTLKLPCASPNTHIFEMAPHPTEMAPRNLR